MSESYWYYAGNRPVNVVVGGVPMLVSPRGWIKAPSTQEWPRPVAGLFTKRNPPPDVRIAFEASAARSAETARRIAEETMAAESDLRTRESSRAPARDGETRKPLDFHEAIEEKGRRDPGDAERGGRERKRQAEGAGHGDAGDGGRAREEGTGTGEPTG